MLRPYISASVLCVDNDARHFAVARRHRDRRRAGSEQPPRRGDAPVRLPARGACPPAGDEHAGRSRALVRRDQSRDGGCKAHRRRSEEHTSELQSLAYLVCRLLLEKKKTKL